MKGHELVFTISFLTSLALMVAGFIIPPTGVIDGSVLTGAGILFAFAALAQLPTLIHGREVKIEKGDMTLHLGDNDDHPVYTTTTDETST